MKSERLRGSLASTIMNSRWAYGPYGAHHDNFVTAEPATIGDVERVDITLEASTGVRNRSTCGYAPLRDWQECGATELGSECPHEKCCTKRRRLRQQAAATKKHLMSIAP